MQAAGVWQAAVLRGARPTSTRKATVVPRVPRVGGGPCAARSATVAASASANGGPSAATFSRAAEALPFRQLLWAAPALLAHTPHVALGVAAGLVLLPRLLRSLRAYHAGMFDEWLQSELEMVQGPQVPQVRQTPLPAAAASHSAPGGESAQRQHTRKPLPAAALCLQFLAKTLEEEGRELNRLWSSEMKPRFFIYTFSYLVSILPDAAHLLGCMAAAQPFLRLFGETADTFKVLLFWAVEAAAICGALSAHGRIAAVRRAMALWEQQP